MAQKSTTAPADPGFSTHSPQRDVDPARQPMIGGGEFFADLFATPRESHTAGSSSDTPSADRTPARGPVERPPREKPHSRAQASQGSPSEPLAGPPVPWTLTDTGMSVLQLGDLLLKQLYLQGNMLGMQLARQTRLPFPVIEESLKYLKEEKCIEIKSGDLIGLASYRFHLTELGRTRAREAFEQCRYVGPAPVSLQSYVAQCRKQAVAGTSCTAEALTEAFAGMIIRAGLLDELGPAVCSGRSIFLYGPPGNGKTLIAKGLGNYLNRFGGEIYIPYAFETEGQIVTLFDPTLHQTTDAADIPIGPAALTDPSELALRAPTATDMRWRRIRRPVIITGGELTLDMLDLRYNKTSNFYTAPLHIKANGGVFLIDDFGRQIVSPKDLLNRWILPLEDRLDYLTLATGKKFSVPFEQLIIFSTNLDPKQLVDDAFLRRIRHKIQIGPPGRELFADLFKLQCQSRKIAYDSAAIEYLYASHYGQGRTPRSSDPRDLLEIAESICRFRKTPVVLSPALMAEAATRFFCQM